jgi:hypothetical protein
MSAIVYYIINNLWGGDENVERLRSLEQAWWKKSTTKCRRSRSGTDFAKTNPIDMESAAIRQTIEKIETLPEDNLPS